MKYQNQKVKFKRDIRLVNPIIQPLELKVIRDKKRILKKYENIERFVLPNNKVVWFFQQLKKKVHARSTEGVGTEIHAE